MGLERIYVLTNIIVGVTTKHGYFSSKFSVIDYWLIISELVESKKIILFIAEYILQMCLCLLVISTRPNDMFEILKICQKEINRPNKFSLVEVHRATTYQYCTISIA